MRQLPVVQLSAAFARAQVDPQEPQLLLVRVFTSQPLECTPSQLARPAAQEVTRQLPVEQLSDAKARLQVVPQPPQLALVVSGVSQPLALLPSQLPVPDEQVGGAVTHEPLEQTLPLGHALPHAPQCSSSVLMFRSQPLAWSPSQFL